MKQILCCMAILVSMPASVLADVCETHESRRYEPGKSSHQLCLYEPNTIGLTWDDDDHERFMDFKLSVRYQMFPEYSTKWLNHVSDQLGDDSAIYFAFSGRFGQYIDTRDSSPVVAKRFNPKIFIRFWGNKDQDEVNHYNSNYLDVSLFNHESNGQSIDNKTGYDLAYFQSSAKGYNGYDAYDHLSRSWDIFSIEYRDKREELIEAALKNQFFKIDTSGYYGLKYFIPGKTEEFNPVGGTNIQGLQGWETDPEGKPRKEVDGVSLAYKGTIYNSGTAHKFSLLPLKYYLGYTTGTHNPGVYNTWRIELGFNIPYVDLPITVYRQTGYNNDLAQYYKKTGSVGIYVDIGSF
ncbi:MAG: phospholipase A [Gallionella sp.]|nr:phospholipase A [Gallionella sp.]